MSPDGQSLVVVLSRSIPSLNALKVSCDPGYDPWYRDS